MQYRHEWKIQLSPADRMVMSSRLSAVMQRDPHAGPDGSYQIRSLYFDNLSDTALREKLDGVCHREKFRIRVYNGDLSRIRLEKKCKDNSLSYKLSAPLTRDETARLLTGDRDWMPESPHQLIRELYHTMLHGGYEPRTIVDYTREPFICETGNVRVTLDYNIRTGLKNTDFLDACSVTVPAGDVCLMEVKYDAFLPETIRLAVQLPFRQTGAFSKYAQCRIYG